MAIVYVFMREQFVKKKKKEKKRKKKEKKGREKEKGRKGKPLSSSTNNFFHFNGIVPR
jgi:hypothetical protein